MCRAILGVKGLSGKFINKSNGTEEDIALPEPLIHPSAATRAVKNANKCVIGSQENMEETKLILSYWFPWMDINNKWPSVKLMQIYKEKETRQDLPEDLIRVLEEVNICDVALHKSLMSRFWKQVELVRR